MSSELSSENPTPQPNGHTHVSLRSKLTDDDLRVIAGRFGGNRELRAFLRQVPQGDRKVVLDALRPHIMHFRVWPDWMLG